MPLGANSTSNRKPEHREFVLGVDGGGSHTLALIAEKAPDGRILAQGTAGPSNMQAVGVNAALSALDEAVTNAFEKLGVPRGVVSAAALGLAGIDSDSAAQVVRDWAIRVQLAHQVSIDNDATLLLAAGTPDGWGLAVIAGTGSIAFSRDRLGHFARSGGWGYLLGDEGSAYALAIGAMRAVARADDGCGSATVLSQRIVDAMGLNRPIDMIQAVYSGDWDRARLASLAPIAMEAFEAGDPVAEQVVCREAHELAVTTVAAARKIHLPLTVPLAMTGGTILNSARYRNRFIDALRVLGVNPAPITLVENPAVGAVKVARQLLASRE